MSAKAAQETTLAIANTTDDEKLYDIVLFLVGWLISLGVTPLNIIKAVRKRETGVSSKSVYQRE